MNSRASSAIPVQRSNTPASIASIGGTSSMELDLPENNLGWREGDKMSSSRQSPLSSMMADRRQPSHSHPWRSRCSRMSSGDEELRRRIAELTNWDDRHHPHQFLHRKHHFPHKYHHHRFEVDDPFGGIWPPPPPAPVSDPIPSSFPLSRPSFMDAHIPYPLWDDDIALGNGRRMGRKGKRGDVEEGGFGWRRDYLPPLYTVDDDFLLLFSKPYHHDAHHFHRWHSPAPRMGHFNNKSETTYRMEFTPKIAPKPVRAKGPKDNFVLAQQNGLGFPLENMTTNKNAYLEFENDWLVDRSLNCRAKKALGSLHRGKPRSGHYFFQLPTSTMWN